MKSLALIIIALTFSFFLFGCQVANDSNINSPNNSLEKKPPKNEKSELIDITGDLVGSQEVVGCCPNAGPFPEYRLTLVENPFPSEISGEHDGNIFMNKVGNGKNKSYMVQFWWTDNGSDYFIEIRGGVFQEDKKTKTLTATFTDAPCKTWIDDVLTSTVPVTFNLTRAPK